MKASVTSSSIVVEIDFSENFTFKYQDEIRSAHWASRSCTLFCAVIYYREKLSGEVKVASYACISDYMKHDKYSVVVFNDAILKHFQEQNPTITLKEINYQSDGCGQHFKQKYMLCYITTVTGISINWHFTATVNWGYFGRGCNFVIFSFRQEIQLMRPFWMVWRCSFKYIDLSKIHISCRKLKITSCPKLHSRPK